MHVLHINTEVGWRGGENQVYLLHRGLIEAHADSVTSTVVCQPGEALHRRLAAEALPHVCIRARGGFDPWFIRRAAAWVRDQDVDILHAHTSHAHSLSLWIAWLTGRRLVVTRRVDFPVGRGWLGRKKYGRRVTRFVAVSDGVRSVMRQSGVPAEQIDVIHSGIDPARLDVRAADRAEMGLPESAQIVTTVGALVDHKGHRHLLDAWSRLEGSRPRAHLLLVGSGSLEDDLRRQAADLGCGRVRFLGYRQDAPAILRASDVFVMPSVEEGLGTSIMDAMTCGLPVVASRTGGIPELLDAGRTGLLVPPADPVALSEALTELLDSPERRTELGTAARAHAPKFEYPAMVQAYSVLYRTHCG